MNYTKEDLQKQKVRDLAKLATSIGIHGAWNMKKAEVIEAILNSNASAPDDVATNDSSDNAQEAIPEVIEESAATDMSAESEEIKEERIQAKLEYVETAPIGSLVAFYAPDGKVRTAKIMKRSVKNQKLKVQTEYHAEYIIPFSDVLWVRTGTRWPRGVYNLLKGIKSDGGKTNKEAEAGNS